MAEKKRKKNIADKALEEVKELGPYDMLRNIERELELVSQGWGHIAFEEKKTPAPRFKEKLQIPHVDIIEHETELEICIECPGMKKEDISLEIDDDSITVSGQMCEERVYHDGQLVGRYQCCKQMSRTISLPKQIIPEDATARYIKNVLEIIAPKAVKERKKVKLSIA